MRKMLIVVVASLAAALSAVYLYGAAKAQLNPRPPGLRVDAGDKRIPVMLGSWCWKNTCADSPAPPELLRVANVSTVALPAFANLTLRFDTAPQHLTVHHWVGEKRHSYELTAPVTKIVGLPAPSVPGTYPMAFEARWDKGAAVYVIQVQTVAK